ncbi:MAG: hypothetical protein J6P98_08305 [Clostridia bacterium]|nr:hypothetical protein [Clostridia bacterium]
MKKVLLTAVVFALAALLAAFCGCILWPSDPAVKPEPAEAPTAAPTAAPTEAPTEAPTPIPEPTEELCDYAYERLDRAEQIMDEVIAFIEAHPIPVYSSDHPFVPADKRSSLNEEEQAVYDALLASAESFTEAELEGGAVPISNALAALYVDRPEIETYFTAVDTGSAWRTSFFEPESAPSAKTHDIEVLHDQLETFLAVGEYVASRIPSEFSALDKYRALSYYIIMNTEYVHVHGAIPNYATCAYGAVVNGYSICQGYALGFEYLCRCAGLDCRRVRNAYNDDNMHFWDIVELDQGTYYVDVTWSDSSVAMQDPTAGLEEYGDNRFFTWFIFPADQHHVSNDGTITTGRGFGKRDWLAD